MAREGLRAGATGWSARRRPMSAMDRDAAQAVAAALPVLAIPQAWVNGSVRPTPDPGLAAVAAPRRGALRRLLEALDLALDAIAAPALILSRSGEILHANPLASVMRSPELGAFRHALAAALAGSSGGAAVSLGASGWELTPLGGGGEPIGFLAILHPPPPEQALGEALRAASGCWKLTARQAEVLELVARGLTNELIADTLGIGRGTVEFHLSGIFDKAGVSNRATLISRVVEVGRQR